MKKKVIGYIFAGPEFGEDEYIFRKLAKRNNLDIVFFDIFAELNEEELKKKIKDCDVVFNNSAEDFAVEFEKTIEEFGKKVIDSTKAFYYSEDKWLFYLKCKEKNIPIPDTILLSEKINIAKKELKDFNYWPVVLKRVEGTSGEFVEKADNLKDAVNVIKGFWQKGSQRLPLIAQELILSPCYRLTLIDGKIVQTAIKDGNNWKKTGVYEKRNKRLKIDDKLKKISNEINKISGIKILGIDFLKKDGGWIALEVNSAPAFDFFACEREALIEKVLKFLKKEAKKN